MSLPLFYEPDLVSHLATMPLSDDSARHCIQVLRMREGDTIEITNGKGLSCLATLSISGKIQAIAHCTSFQEHSRPAAQVTLCMSLLKNPQRLEWLLEKATEIGMAGFQPIICKRTETSRFRRDRLENILVSAMLQSRQFFLPALHEPMRFEELLEQPAVAEQWIAHCMDTEKKPLSNFYATGEAKILIGPEGDFSAEEIQTSIEKKYLPVSLGHTRLRTETAGLVAVTLLLKTFTNPT
jgi:16S rRNA (uracil1498-N3)-methyltransferase